MLPVLAQLGPFTLYTYSALLNLGLAAALGWLYWAAPADRRARWLDVGLAAVVGGLLGARAVYVAVNAAYYAAHPLEAFMLWQGGLAWVGAAGGALLGAGWWARRRGEPLGPILDALAGPLAALSALGWGGCLAAGCGYGAEVAAGQLPAWLVSTAPDLYGLSVPRWPTQLAGLLWGGISLWLVWSSRTRRWPAGALGLYALSLTALGAFALGFVRGEPTPLAAGFRLDVVGAALVLVAATLGWASRVRPSAPRVDANTAR